MAACSHSAIDASNAEEEMAKDGVDTALSQSWLFYAASNGANANPSETNRRIQELLHALRLPDNRAKSVELLWSPGDDAQRCVQDFLNQEQAAGAQAAGHVPGDDPSPSTRLDTTLNAVTLHNKAVETLQRQCHQKRLGRDLRRSARVCDSPLNPCPVQQLSVHGEPANNLHSSAQAGNGHFAAWIHTNFALNPAARYGTYACRHGAFFENKIAQAIEKPLAISIDRIWQINDYCGWLPEVRLADEELKLHPRGSLRARSTLRLNRPPAPSQE